MVVDKTGQQILVSGVLFTHTITVEFVEHLGYIAGNLIRFSHSPAKNGRRQSRSPFPKVDVLFVQADRFHSRFWGRLVLIPVKDPYADQRDT